MLAKPAVIEANSLKKDLDGMSNPISRWLSSDIGYSFRNSKTAMVAAFIAFVFIFCALFAKWVAPYNPFDAASLELMDSLLPPAWSADGSLSLIHI